MIQALRVDDISKLLTFMSGQGKFETLTEAHTLSNFKLFKLLELHAFCLNFCGVF